jgi:hypothetical protein
LLGYLTQLQGVADRHASHPVRPCRSISRGPNGGIRFVFTWSLYTPGMRPRPRLRFLTTAFLFLTHAGREHIGCRKGFADLSLLCTGAPHPCNLLHDLNSNLEFRSHTYLLNLDVLTECDCVYRDTPVFYPTMFWKNMNLYVHFSYETLCQFPFSHSHWSKQGAHRLP